MCFGVVFGMDCDAFLAPLPTVFIFRSLFVFAKVRECSNVSDFNSRYIFLTAKLHTSDLGYQWESDKLTVRHHKRWPRGQPFPSR